MDEAAYLPKFQTRFGGGEPDPLTGLPLMNGYIEDENQQYGPEFNGELVNVRRMAFIYSSPTVT